MKPVLPAETIREMQRSAMKGRSVPDLEDVDAVAFSVLRHRVVMNFQAEGVGIEKVLALGGLPPPAAQPLTGPPRP